jgi:hypothetical protein
MTMRLSRLKWWLINVAILALSFCASFYLLFAVHRWAWPNYWGPTVNIMSATGYSMGNAVWWSLILALPLIFLPRIREIPGRYVLAFAVVMMLSNGVEAYRVYSRSVDGTTPYSLQSQRGLSH